MSTVEGQHASDEALAVGRLLHPSQRRARRFASWGRVSLVTDGVALAVALLIAHFASGATAVPVAWTFVFAALAIGLLSAKHMYRPPLDLRVLETTRSVIAAVAVAAAMTVALRGLVADASSAADETIRPWLLATAFVIAGRIWLIGSERRARRGVTPVSAR